MGYNIKVIKSFAHKGLEKLFYNNTKKGIKAEYAQKLLDILDRLDASYIVEDMNFPGSNLHELSGKKKGIWTVKVSGNWLVTFKFENGEAHVVSYEGYH